MVHETNEKFSNVLNCFQKPLLGRSCIGRARILFIYHLQDEERSPNSIADFKTSD